MIRWAATWQNQQNGCAPSEDSDQPGHPPSLIRVFAVYMKKPWVLSYPLRAQRRLWSDWADAQTDLSLRWTHTHFDGFVMSRLRWPRSRKMTSWPSLYVLHTLNFRQNITRCSKYDIRLRAACREGRVERIWANYHLPWCTCIPLSLN